MPRAVDSIDLARLAKAERMRAIVIKNHFVPTASDAYFVRKVVPGIEVFGGIDLNLTVADESSRSREHGQDHGPLCRIVWMTSFDSCAQVRACKRESSLRSRLSRRQASAGDAQSH